MKKAQTGQNLRLACLTKCHHHPPDKMDSKFHILEAELGRTSVNVSLTHAKSCSSLV